MAGHLCLVGLRMQLLGCFLVKARSQNTLWEEELLPCLQIHAPVPHTDSFNTVDLTVLY